MRFIRDIELVKHAGATKEAPRAFEIRVFLKFRKVPLSLWLSTDINKIDIVKSITNFAMQLLEQ